MRVQNKRELFSLLAQNQARLRSFGVQRLGVFGSFARDEQKENSDIDILVEFAPQMKSFDNFMGLAFFLEDTLGRKVELQTRESLSPYIGKHILREVEYASIGG